MATIDDDLIDNLREALEHHTSLGDLRPLLSAAQEIVDRTNPGLTFDQARTAGRVQDRDDDIWTRIPDGEWRVAGGVENYGLSLGDLIKLYGPLREVRDE